MSNDKAMEYAKSVEQEFSKKHRDLVDRLDDGFTVEAAIECNGVEIRTGPVNVAGTVLRDWYENETGKNPWHLIGEAFRRRYENFVANEAVNHPLSQIRNLPDWLVAELDTEEFKPENPENSPWVFDEDKYKEEMDVDDPVAG